MKLGWWRSCAGGFEILCWGLAVESAMGSMLVVVASDRRCDIWGLRVDQTRRRPGVSDNLAGKAKNFMGGS